MGMRIRGWWRCRRRVAGEGVRWGAADGGRRRILRGTVTEEPGKGGVHQDGRRVFERGVLRRPARVSRTNPFPRVRPPFPAMEPPPSVCRYLSYLRPNIPTIRAGTLSFQLPPAPKALDSGWNDIMPTTSSPESP